MSSNSIFLAVPSVPEIDECLETALATFRRWLEPIYGNHVDRALCVHNNDPPYEIADHQSSVVPDGYKRRAITAKIWTATNEYTIRANFEAHGGQGYSSSDTKDGYLGCSSVSRKQRPGEIWNRGGDLTDGKFNDETWARILTYIVQYEAEEIKSGRWKERYEQEPARM